MIVRSFLDSNVFVYVNSHRFPDKQQVAADLFERARATGPGVVSTQVMQEYCSAVTGKVKAPAVLARHRGELMAQLSVAQVDPPLILAAIDRHQRYRLGMRAALILRAAVAAAVVSW